MTSLFLTLGTISDGTGLPAAPPAPHPLKRAGTLSLIDPTYPSGAWAAGIPATVPNLAGGEAFGIASTIAGGIVERTGRGAFHAAAPVTATGNQTVTFTSAAARQKIIDAIAAGHDLGIAEVYRITRESQSGVTQAVSYRWAGLITNGGTNDVATLRASSAGTVVGYPRDRVTSETAGTTLISTGPQVSSTVLKGTGTAGSSTAILTHANGGAGSKQATRITYLHIIEDLTASGITAAAFRDSVAAWRAKELGTGGRYWGDTWSPVTS